MFKIDVIFVALSIILFGFLTNVVFCQFGCGSQSKAVCLNSVAYRDCTKYGNPTGNTKHCKAGKICTNDESICVAPATAGGRCAEFSKAYCVTSTTYQLCNANGQLQDDILSCVRGTVCTNDPDICITPPEIPQKAPSAEKICAHKETTGRFAIDDDTTCKKYVYCYIYNKKLMGEFGTCIGSTIFNPAKQLCVSSGYKCPSN